MGDTALRGVRVLDLATLYPAPLLAAMLADLGADVVKIEPPQGDPLRTMGAGPWSIVGRNKRSVVVDFDKGDHLRLLHQLVGVADVVVLNQPAPVLERWSCTDDDLMSRNPRLILVHVSCFGSTGPYADRIGNGTLAEAFIGLPENFGVPVGDTVGAMHGVQEVLAALFQRERSDQGVVVDVALYEALLPLIAPRLAGVAPSAMVRRRFLTSDGHAVAVSATTTNQLERLDNLVGPSAEEWFAARPSAEAVAALLDARVPAVAVNGPDDLRRDAHIVARGALPDMPRAPGLGEHTAEVVEEWLHGGKA